MVKKAKDYVDYANQIQVTSGFGYNTAIAKSKETQARENARLVRDQISEEIWREINRFHLLIKSSHNDRHWHKNPIDFFRKVIDLCMLLSGLINSTILHEVEVDIDIATAPTTYTYFSSL